MEVNSWSEFGFRCRNSKRRGVLFFYLFFFFVVVVLVVVEYLHIIMCSTMLLLYVTCFYAQNKNCYDMYMMDGKVKVDGTNDDVLFVVLFSLFFLYFFIK